MKATRSNDGVLRFTLKIPVRVGISELVDALGTHLVHHCDLYDATNKAMAVEAALKSFRSRRSILDKAIGTIAKEGESIWTWSDGISSELEDQIREQATVLVRKKFPELMQNEPTQ